MKELKINVPEGYEIDKYKSTFENIVFKKKKEFPKNLIDLRELYGWRTDFWGNIFNHNVCDELQSKNLFRTYEQANASLALAQLSQLRDVYRGGWEPDWDNKDTKKSCIVFYLSEIMVDCKWYENSFLSFQDDETAELFLKNFRDLIKQAKPLMS